MRTFSAFAVVAIVLVSLALMVSEDAENFNPPPEIPSPPEDVEPDVDIETASADSEALDITAALSHGSIPSTSFDEVYAEVRLNATEMPPEIRPPLNVALVVDRSGSMHGEPMERAREASKTFVRALEPQDRITLVAFSHASTILVNSTPVDEAGQAKLLRAIDGLQAGGTTNISGGLRDGFDEVERFAEPEMVNRVVLMTDGIPNVGITGSDGLAGKTRMIRQSGVTVTALGFGASYDAQLMARMAEEGAGNFRHISDAAELEMAFAQEISDLQSTVASGVQLEFRPRDGVEIEEIYGFSREEITGGERITVGDLHTEARRSAVVRLKVDEGVVGDERDLIDVQFRYVDRLTDSPVASKLELRAQVVADDSEVEESIDGDVIARVEQMRTQDSVQEAMEMYASGNQRGATERLERERGRIQSARRQYNIEENSESAQDLDLFLDRVDDTVQNHAPSSARGRSGGAAATADSLQMMQGR